MAGQAGFLSELELAWLFNELRGDGYPLAPDQLAAAIRVLRQAAATATPPHRLPGLLVPILAKSPAQRDNCYRRLADMGIAATRPLCEVSGAAPVAPRPRMPGRIWPVIAAGGVLLAAILAWAYLSQPTPNPPTQQEIPRPTATTQVTVRNEIRQFTTVDKIYQPLRLAMLLVPLMTWGAWLALRWRWRRAIDVSDRGEAGFDLLDLGARPFGGELFTDPSLSDIAQDWRSHRRLGTAELDVRRTVDATIASGGLFKSVSAMRPVSPQYLLLVEERGRHDHLARMIDNICQRLSDDGVSIKTYYYRDSLWHLRIAHPFAIEFTEIARVGTRSEATLVIVGTGQALFQPNANRLEPRIERELNRWQRRIFLSTMPVTAWGDRELALLHTGFALGTARQRGFAGVGRYVAAGFPGHRPLIEPITVEPNRG